MSDYLQVPKGTLVLPLVLRLDGSGGIDWMRYEEVVWEYVGKKGVNALFLASTTGRCHELDSRTRGKLFGRVHDICVGHGVTIMVGCMDTCLGRMLEHLHEVARRGCQMVVASPPWYARLSQRELANDRKEGVLNVFAREAAHKGVSVVLYDIPSRAGSWLASETIVRLAEAHENIVAVKDSSGENRAELSEVLPYFTGREDQLLEAMQRGASGCVSSLAHISPQLFQRTIDLALTPEISGHRFDAQTLQSVISAGHQSFLDVSELHSGAFLPLMRYLEACIGLKLTHPWEGFVSVPSGSRELWRAPKLLPSIEPVWFGE